MKRWLLLLCIFLTPFLLMIGVNTFSPTPTDQAIAAYCTRACHTYGCAHYPEAAPAGSFKKMVKEVYVQNILWLRHNPLGISYQEMNILVYVVISPVLFILLIWGVIRKGGQA